MVTTLDEPSPIEARDLPPVPPADLIPVRARPTPLFRLVRLGICALAHSLFRITVEGADNFPDGPYVAIANHSGWADALFLAAVLPSSPQPHVMGDPTTLVRLRVGGIPVGRAAWWLMCRAGGMIPVDRTKHGDDLLRKQVASALQVGGALVLCPEGRYFRFPGEDPDQLLPFKPGFARVAAAAGAPIVPITINGARRLWWLKRVHVSVATPIPTAAAEWREAGRQARDVIAIAHQPDTDAGRLRPFQRLMTYNPLTPGVLATREGSHL